MDQPSGRSFMQVLCEKYSPENFPYRRGPGMGVHVPATPQGSPMKGKKDVTSNIYVLGAQYLGLQTRILSCFQMISFISELELHSLSPLI